MGEGDKLFLLNFAGGVRSKLLLMSAMVLLLIPLLGHECLAESVGLKAHDAKDASGLNLQIAVPSNMSASPVPSSAQNSQPDLQPDSQASSLANSQTSSLANLQQASIVPVKVMYVSENQPVQIVDSLGHLVQVIYLKKK